MSECLGLNSFDRGQRHTSGDKGGSSDSGSFPLLVGPSQTRFSPVTAEERVQICLVQRRCFADIRANDQTRFRPARKSRDRTTAARLGGRIGFGIRSQRGGPQVLELLAMNCWYCDVQMPRDAVKNVSLWYVTSTRRAGRFWSCKWICRFRLVV